MRLSASIAATLALASGVSAEMLSRDASDVLDSAYAICMAALEEPTSATDEAKKRGFNDAPPLPGNDQWLSIYQRAADKASEFQVEVMTFPDVVLTSCQFTANAAPTSDEIRAFADRVRAGAGIDRWNTIELEHALGFGLRARSPGRANPLIALQMGTTLGKVSVGISKAVYAD